MSKRYIDADALCEHLQNKLKTDYEMGLYNHGAFTESFIRFVERQPAADVVEVRHGEWLKSSPYNRFMNCSVCGFGQNHTSFPYCPMCGAEMSGKRRNENEG